MTHQIAILRGDGIGPEITAQAVRVLDKLIEQGLDAQYQYAPLGGEAYDQYGAPYPEFTQTSAAPPMPCCSAQSARPNTTA